MDKICKNCKHFDSKLGYYGNTNGQCDRLGANELLISDTLSNKFISFHGDSNPVQVCVGENFGCIHFQEKKDDIDW